MALAKQTLNLMFLSAYIIFATCMNAHSAPSLALAAGPTRPEAYPADKPSKPPFPDIRGTMPKATAGKQADVANVVAKQMQAVEKKIDEFNAKLKKRMDNPECVSECEEVFGAAIDDIKKTLDSLDSQNLMKANFDVSAVSTNVDTCNDCFEEMDGGDPEVKKLGDWVRKITGDALEALQKATT